VFADGRNALARESALARKTQEASLEPKAFVDLMDRFHFQWAVTSARDGERMDPALAESADWAMLYVDDLAAIYVLREGVNRARASEGYRRLRHLINPNQVLASVIREPALATDLAHDGALALAQAPFSARAAFLAACGALAIRDADAFDSARRRLAWLVPDHPALAILAQQSRRLEKK
jgi:hypothetical protein